LPLLAGYIFGERLAAGRPRLQYVWKDYELKSLRPVRGGKGRGRGRRART